MRVIFKAFSRTQRGLEGPSGYFFGLKNCPYPKIHNLAITTQCDHSSVVLSI